MINAPALGVLLRALEQRDVMPLPPQPAPVAPSKAIRGLSAEDNAATPSKGQPDTRPSESRPDSRPQGQPDARGLLARQAAEAIAARALLPAPAATPAAPPAAARVELSAAAVEAAAARAAGQPAMPPPAPAPVVYSMPAGAAAQVAQATQILRTTPAAPGGPLGPTQDRPQAPTRAGAGNPPSILLAPDETYEFQGRLAPANPSAQPPPSAGVSALGISSSRASAGRPAPTTTGTPLPPELAGAVPDEAPMVTSGRPEPPRGTATPSPTPNLGQPSAPASGAPTSAAGRQPPESQPAGIVPGNLAEEAPSTGAHPSNPAATPAATPASGTASGTAATPAPGTASRSEQPIPGPLTWRSGPSVQGAYGAMAWKSIQTAQDHLAAPASGNPAPSAGTDLRLSQTAMQIGQLLAPPNASGTRTPMPAILIEQTPLLPSRPLAAERAQLPVGVIAEALERSVRRSGLFYESHLASWAGGEFPTSELQQEPQANWPRSAPSAGAETMAAGGAVSGDTTNAGDATNGLAAATASGGETSSVEALPPLVRQQIDALESRQLAWLGELWPGQRIAITVEEDDRRRANSEPQSAPPIWRTHMELELPRLGLVGINLAWVDGSLAIDVSAVGVSGVDRLRNGGQDLLDALAARSIPVAGLTFRHEQSS